MLFNLNFLFHAKKVKTVPWQFYHYCLNGASLSHTYREDRWEKLLKMLDVLNNKNNYSDIKELELRLARTAIFYSMAAIGNAIRRPNTTRAQILDEIHEIANNKKLLSYISDYPVFKLPLKWLIYTIALKLKMSSVLYKLLGGKRNI